MIDLGSIKNDKIELLLTLDLKYDLIINNFHIRAVNIRGMNASTVSIITEIGKMNLILLFLQSLHFVIFKVYCK